MSDSSDGYAVCSALHTSDAEPSKRVKDSVRRSSSSSDTNGGHYAIESLTFSLITYLIFLIVLVSVCGWRIKYQAPIHRSPHRIERNGTNNRAQSFSFHSTLPCSVLSFVDVPHVARTVFGSVLFTCSFIGFYGKNYYGEKCKRETNAKLHLPN